MYRRTKLKNPVLGMSIVNWSLVGEEAFAPSFSTTPTTRTLFPAVLVMVVEFILFSAGCKKEKQDSMMKKIILFTFSSNLFCTQCQGIVKIIAQNLPNQFVQAVWILYA